MKSKEKMFYGALLGAVTGAVLMGAAPAEAKTPQQRNYCDYPLATNPHLPEVNDCSESNGSYTS